MLSPNLEVLNLAFNPLFDINDQTFERFSNLKSLNLSACVIKSKNIFNTFFHQTQLIELDLSYSGWSDEIDFSNLTRRFKNLEVLNIEGNYLHTVRGLKSSIFPKLKTLGLSKNQFSCRYLATLLDGWSNLNLIYNPTEKTHIDGIDCILNDS